MTINYYVVQENKLKERQNKFLFSDDTKVKLFVGSEVAFKRKTYKVMEIGIQRVSLVHALCYEVKKPKIPIIWKEDPSLET